MDKDKTIKELQNEITELKKDFEKFKRDLNTEIVNQQNTSRDPFRTDRGEIILKKNAVIKSRNSLVDNVRRVLSIFFNDSATEGKNVIYIGSDGGNENGNVSQVSNIISAKEGEDTVFNVLKHKVDSNGNRVNDDVGKELRLSIQSVSGNEISVLITPNKDNSFSGLANLTEIKDSNGNFLSWASFLAEELEPVISVYPNKTLKVITHDTNFNPTVHSGVTYAGSVGSITVVRGIVTSVSPAS